jgi:hypothetical protein
MISLYPAEPHDIPRPLLRDLYLLHSLHSLIPKQKSCMPHPLLAIYLLYERSRKLFLGGLSVFTIWLSPSLSYEILASSQLLSVLSLLPITVSVSTAIICHLNVEVFWQVDEFLLTVIIRSGQEKLRAVDDILFHILFLSNSFLSSRSESVIHSAFS